MPIAQLDLGKLRNHILQRGDLVVTRTGAYLGKAAVFADFRLPVVAGAFSIYFRLDPKIADPLFFRYYFNSIIGQAAIKSITTGSAQPNINITNFKQLVVPLPALEEQTEIRDFVSALDDKIELNRRMNATLEAMARALFQSWFVDFDPVRAKAAGQTPAGMDRATADLFQSEFEDSELGEIPKGWKVGRIKECCQRIHSGGTPRRDEPRYWHDGEIPWLTSGEVRQPMITSTEAFISELGLEESSAKWVDASSTVVALYGATAGQVAFLATRATTNQAICSLIPKRGFEYFNYFSMRGATTEMENKAVGSAQQNISKGIVEETAIVLPSSGVLNRFNDVVGPFFRSWIDNVRQSNTLAALRDALLPKLLSGEIRVGISNSSEGGLV